MYFPENRRKAVIYHSKIKKKYGCGLFEGCWWLLFLHRGQTDKWIGKTIPLCGLCQLYSHSQCVLIHSVFLSSKSIPLCFLCSLIPMIHRIFFSGLYYIKIYRWGSWRGKLEGQLEAGARMGRWRRWRGSWRGKLEGGLEEGNGGGVEVGSWRGDSRHYRERLSSSASSVVSFFLPWCGWLCFRGPLSFFFCMEFLCPPVDTLMKNSCSLPVPQWTSAGHTIPCSTNLLHTRWGCLLLGDCFVA